MQGEPTRNKAIEVAARLLPAIADTRVKDAPEAWTEAVKEAALTAGADQVGIAKLRQE